MKARAPRPTSLSPCSRRGPRAGPVSPCSARAVMMAGAVPHDRRQRGRDASLGLAIGPSVVDELEHGASRDDEAVDEAATILSCTTFDFSVLPPRSAAVARCVRVICVCLMQGLMGFRDDEHGF